jgi:UDP-N-acetylmuramate: L-alanyl-gamma-D-glutamyl-meso-diaminopimelate ligase
VLCVQAGLSLEQIRQGLATFGGVRRRQDVRGIVDNVVVIDDFAHHPTKVRETVKGLKSRYPTRRLWAIFEPRTASSRRDFFQKDYINSFLDADRVVVADVFHPEQIEPGRLFNSPQLVEDLLEAGKDACFLPTADDIVTLFRRELQAGDVVLVMSNGAFDGILDKTVGMLEERLKSRPHPVQPLTLSVDGVLSLNGGSRVKAVEVRKAV